MVSLFLSSLQSNQLGVRRSEEELCCSDQARTKCCHELFAKGLSKLWKIYGTVHRPRYRQYHAEELEKEIRSCRLWHQYLKLEEKCRVGYVGQFKK